MDELQIKKREIDTLFNRLMDENKSNSVKSKIKALHAVCMDMTQKNSVLKVSSVIQRMTSDGHKISKQSMYNKMDGNNPYRKLFDAWSDYSNLQPSKISSEKNTASTNQGLGKSLITEEDIKSISNPVLQYKLSLIFSELRSLRTQNDLLKKASKSMPVQLAPTAALLDNPNDTIMLDDYELDILHSFVHRNSNLGFDEDGVLFAKSPIPKGTFLSEDSLFDALKKVLRSYNKD